MNGLVCLVYSVCVVEAHDEPRCRNACPRRVRRCGDFNYNNNKKNYVASIFRYIATSWIGLRSCWSVVTLMSGSFLSPIGLVDQYSQRLLIFVGLLPTGPRLMLSASINGPEYCSFTRIPDFSPRSSFRNAPSRHAVSIVHFCAVRRSCVLDKEGDDRRFGSHYIQFASRSVSFVAAETVRRFRCRRGDHFHPGLSRVLQRSFALHTKAAR